MFEKLELVDKINKEWKGRGKNYIGYDLGAGYGEISVFTEQDLTPATLLSRKDATVFHFPCILVKYNGRFYAGFEALSLAGEAESIVFQDLLEIAMKQPTIVAGGQRFETEYLLGLFLKLTLVLPEQYGKVEKAGGIMFTTHIDEDPALQTRVYEVLTRATANLFHKKTKLYLQTRSESIYYFLMNQEESLYRENTLVCDFQKDYLKGYFFNRLGNCPPYQIEINRVDYLDMQVPKEDRGEALAAASLEAHQDEVFRQVILDVESKFDFGLSYLIGDGFKGGWMEQSLVRLCDHGRAFQGNNLYSLGACYSLRELVAPNPVLQEYIYLSKQNITHEIGMFCVRQSFLKESSQPEYITLFSRGSFYKDCKRTFYLLPEGETELILEARAISEQESRRLSVDLGELPLKEAGSGKLLVTLEFLEQHILQVSVQDVGLGQLAPGSGQSIQKTFDLA